MLCFHAYSLNDRCTFSNGLVIMQQKCLNILSYLARMLYFTRYVTVIAIIIIVTYYKKISLQAEKSVQCKIYSEE